MASDDFDGAMTSDGGSGVSRRDAIKKGAVVGGAVLWATPVIQAIGISPMSVAHASHGACVCTGTNSFDVTAAFTGVISGNVGPIMDFPADGANCLATLSVSAPALLASAFLTANADCVGGTTSGGTCSSFVELANLAVDLRAINSALDIQLNASLVRAEASCTCGGGCTKSSCITQAATTAILKIGGANVLMGAGVALCSRQAIGVNIPATLTLPAVTGTIVLNDTSTNPCQATVAKIDVVVAGVQTVSIVIAQATAVCTQH